MRRAFVSAVILASLVVLPGRARVVGAASGTQAVQMAQGLSSTMPVAAEHRYRMAAKIRPLLLFWIGRDNVGGARLLWRRGAEGTRGWELLIGSDPDRAPTHVNRWGYVREEVADGQVSMLGVMKQSDEQSLDEARARTANESNTGYVYKLIRSRVSQGESSAVITTSSFPRDYTYRDLPALLRAFDSQPVHTSGPKQARIGQGVKAGFLVAIADLLHDSVYAYKRSGASALNRWTVTYVYNGRLYDMTLARPKVLKNAEYGGRTYTTLLQGDFEVRNQVSGGKEAFSIVYGIDGPIEEVPVYMAYQPRWWFKAELVLDENERFDH